jgi:hypothetical protein
MTKEEILKLHEKEEWEQVELLRMCGVLGKKPNEHGRISKWSKYESLAECAFRLRDEWVTSQQNKVEVNWFMPLRRLFWFTEGNSWPSAYRMSKAKPIHWIQAALLAKEEK